MCVTSEKMGIFTLFLQKNNQKKFGNFSTTDIHPREIINPSHPSASVPSVNIPPIRGKLNPSHPWETDKKITLCAIYLHISEILRTFVG